MICPNCQRELHGNPSICPVCGRKLGGGGFAGRDATPGFTGHEATPGRAPTVKPFNPISMLGLIALSVLVPIAGLVAGGMNLKHPCRREQSKLLIGVALGAWLIVMLIAFS